MGLKTSQRSSERAYARVLTSVEPYIPQDDLLLDGLGFLEQACHPLRKIEGLVGHELDADSRNEFMARADDLKVAGSFGESLWKEGGAQVV